MKHIIEVENLRKAYGAVEAVKGISFYAETGRLFAFLGPNGAGKSTTIDMICTFLKPDSGSVLVNGHTLGKEDDAIRRSIGVVFQDSLLDRRLSVRENMVCRGAVYGLKGRTLDQAVDRAMTSVGVNEYAKRPYGKLSGGQRRRCDIARALINTPRILFLDEPTTGLDPQTRKVVWETIRTLQRDSGMTVFLTTHYMEEASGADYVIVIDDGEIAAKGTPSQLCDAYASDRLKLVCGDPEAVSGILSGLNLEHTKRPGQLEVKLKKTVDALPILEKCRSYIESFEVTAGSMDDAFIGITGKELRE
ncbi:ATP-binding cassette domain-containing protein [Eubacteriales bacterium DFI.9.88]|nr:ATP-binding cassette domain-containing protein [Eubacteriales bacterium DFI.9.88]